MDKTETVTTSVGVSKQLGVAHDKIIETIETLNGVYTEFGMPLIRRRENTNAYELTRTQYVDVYSAHDPKFRVKMNQLARNTKSFDLNVLYSNKVELVYEMLTIYATVLNLNNKCCYLRPRLVEVLSYYIIFGYNDETKEKIKNNLEIDVKNLNQLNSELVKKGFLIKSPNHSYKKFLAPVVEDFMNYFLYTEKPCFKISVEKAKN